MTESGPSPQTTTEPKPARPAFEEVYREQFAYVYHTLRRLGIRAADLADVTHDVFLAVYRHMQDYDPSRPLRPWLFGFAFRMASDSRKSARQRLVLSADEGEIDAHGAAPDEDIEARELRRDLLRALDAMDFDKRAVIVMHDIDGQTAPEMAAFLDVPLNTVYSRIRLARAELEMQLRKVRGTSE